MENYFNYFTEIEDHFQRRRGSLLLLSTLDWALIETWRDAGVPLAAVLRGIDAAFEKYESRKSRARVRRINGLAYCTQEVMSAVEEMKEASIGAAPEKSSDEPTPGFETDRIAAHLESCADELAAVALTGIAQEAAHEMSQRLRGLATGVRSSNRISKNWNERHRAGRKALRNAAGNCSRSHLTSVREQASRTRSL